jgi:hypothetical protein
LNRVSLNDALGHIMTAAVAMLEGLPLFDLIPQ